VIYYRASWRRRIADIASWSMGGVPGLLKSISENIKSRYGDWFFGDGMGSISIADTLYLK
jgi:hypothetical protein